MNEKEINTILAEKAMQWTMVEKTLWGGVARQWYKNGKFIVYEETWRPWDKDMQALQVAQKMVEYINAADRYEIGGGKDLFSCRFIRLSGVAGESTLGFSVDQPTLAIAICLATLDALGIEVGDKNGQEETR